MVETNAPSRRKILKIGEKDVCKFSFGYVFFGVHSCLGTLYGSFLSSTAILLLMSSQIIPSLSGYLVSCLFLMSWLVVEMDLPWDSSQVETYGASFKAWDEKDFSKAWTAVKKALPHNQLACVV